jgi:hypothetical protein
MRTPDEVAAMQRLHGLGWGTRRIAVEVACNRETVQRDLAAGAWAPCRVPTRPGQLGGQAAWLSERLRCHRGNADVVRQELASELGIVVSLRMVERSVSHLRHELAAEALATVRCDSAPKWDPCRNLSPPIDKATICAWRVGSREVANRDPSPNEFGERLH